MRLLLEHDTPVDIVALQCAVDAEDDEVRISAIIKSPRQPKQEIERTETENFLSEQNGGAKQRRTDRKF